MTTNIKVEIDPQAGTMELVQQAQAAYDAGRDREWAGALWLAGERAVRELGKRRGIPASGDLIAILKHLDQRDAKTRDDYYIVKLSGLMMLETHYRLGALESYWWEDLHSDVIAFIAHCHAAAT